jgi:putative NADPH-quinone reductase
MASLSDILTTAKNIASAINNVAQTYVSVQGAQVRQNITAATVVSSAPGRLAMVSITTGGSANGVIYDAAATGVTSRPIYAIPNTIGIVFVNLPVIYGIVVAPGTGQVVTVSYS